MNKKFFLLSFLIIFMHLFCFAQKDNVVDNTIASVKIKYPENEKDLIKAINEMYKKITSENKELLEKKDFISKSKIHYSKTICV